MPAATVMTESVYGVEAAFVIVRLQAGFRLETMRRGKSPAKKATVVATIASELRIKLALSLPIFMLKSDDKEQGCAEQGDSSQWALEEIRMLKSQQHAEYEEDGSGNANLDGKFLAAQDEARILEPQGQESGSVEQEDEQERKAADNRVE